MKQGHVLSIDIHFMDLKWIDEDGKTLAASPTEFRDLWNKLVNKMDDENEMLIEDISKFGKK